MRSENDRLHEFSHEGESWKRWVHDLRRAEVDRAMQHVPLGSDSTVLDLGCGDGFATALLCERFARVFSVDPEEAPRGASASRFSYAMAEALPFSDSTFDLVFSSSVLEHLKDRSCGVNEAARVLRPGGYMVHIVPGRFWKLASLALNPVGYPLRVAEKWRAARRLAGHAPADFRSGGK
jgi:SAM-dependent methyltransferase